MRVLHVHSGNLYGGVETLMVTLARNRNLCPPMEPHFALCFESRLKEELTATEVPVHSLGKVRVSRPPSVMRARSALRELLGRESFDVAVCHSAWSQAIFGPVIRAADLRLVFWLHGAANGRHWLERWARKCRPDFVICNSLFTESTLSNLYPGVPSEVLYCPVELTATNHSEAEREEVRAELQTPADSTVIIQVSRIEPGKGHKLHLEALGLLRDLSGWVCWQAGGGQRPRELKYQEELKALADELGIADRVRFIGERSDVGSLLRAADIYCQPNTSAEGFGIVFIEALAEGLPVVTTAIGGAIEIVDECCGVCVPPDEPKILADSLRLLIEDSILRMELGNAGPARARTLCDPATQIQKLHQLLAATYDHAEEAHKSVSAA
jgi:glycosyltransferase involved in cell wall biosynthesis